MCLLQVTMAVEITYLKETNSFEEQLSTKTLNFNRESHDVIIGEQVFAREDDFQQNTNEIATFEDFSSDKTQRIDNFKREDMSPTTDFTMYPSRSETLMPSYDNGLGAECSSNCKQCLNSTHCETCKSNNINQGGQ